MSTAAVNQEAVPALNEGQRLLYTFIAPSKTMADLRRSASWWVPWLVLSIVSLTFGFTVDKKIGWGQVADNELQSNVKAQAQFEKMTPEQRAGAEKMRPVIFRILGYAWPVLLLLFLVVNAGVLLVLFNFGFGAKLTFKQTLGISAYGWLPSLIKTLLMITVVFFVAPDSFDINYPVATNPGYFIPTSMPFWKAFLGVFDLFTVWNTALVAVGISQLSKVKASTAFGAMFTLLVLFTLGSAALKAM